MKELMYKYCSEIKNITYSTYIACLVAFTQGMTGLSALAISYMFKDDLGVSPGNLTFYQNIINISWIIKPFWGFISDGFPIGGQRRKPYLLLFSFLNFFIWTVLGVMHTQGSALTITILFFQSFSMAFINVIGEAIMVENARIQNKNNDDSQDKHAVNNVSLFFGTRSVGFLITSYLSGAILQHISKYTVFLITSCFSLVLFTSTLFFKEKPMLNEACEIERNSKVENVVKLWKFVKQREIYIPVFVIFIFLSTPSNGSITFYFLTNKLKFSEEMMGRLVVVASLASVIGITIYNKFLSNSKFKSVIFCTTIIGFFLGLTQILLVTRYNLVLGIPDGIFSFSDSLITLVFAEINFMPIVVLACKLCPKNIEGTMYALLMSIINLGGMVSDFFGGILITILNLNETNFDNLVYLIIITSTFKLLPLWLIFYTDFDKQKAFVEQINEVDPSSDQSPLERNQDLEMVNFGQISSQQKFYSTSKSILK